MASAHPRLSSICHISFSPWSVTIPICLMWKRCFPPYRGTARVLTLTVKPTKIWPWYFYDFLSPPSPSRAAPATAASLLSSEPGTARFHLRAFALMRFFFLPWPSFLQIPLWLTLSLPEFFVPMFLVRCSLHPIYNSGTHHLPCNFHSPHFRFVTWNTK